LSVARRQKGAQLPNEVLRWMFAAAPERNGNYRHRARAKEAIKLKDSGQKNTAFPGLPFTWSASPNIGATCSTQPLWH